MAINKKDISQWIDLGKEQKATHLIVICDTFDYKYYPAYVMPNEDVHKKAKSFDSMQKIMEIYDLNKNIDSQLNKHRVFNY